MTTSIVRTATGVGANSPETAQALARWVDAQEKYLGKRWLEGLDPRKQEEAQFHDLDRLDHRDERPDSSPNRRFYEAAGVVTAHVNNWIGQHATSGTGAFLDYACGNGYYTIEAAKAGAALALGIDISATSVKNAAENARHAALGDRTRFLQRDCENTQLPSDTFSSVLCSGMLHHLDLSKAFPELARITAPGGRILCVEALGYNPFIKLYRNRTPHLRTSWEKEHILTMREVEFATQWFSVENIQFFLMAAPLATLFPAGSFRKYALRTANLIDAIVTRIPKIQLWSWQFAFELVKN